MRYALLFLCIGLSAQSVLTKGPSDSILTSHALRGHPRLYLDGTWAGTGGSGCPSTAGTEGYWSCRLKDPDGAGSGQSTYYNSYAAQLMRRRIGSSSPSISAYWDGDVVMSMALMYYMCNQCTVPWSGSTTWGAATKALLLAASSNTYNNADYPLFGQYYRGFAGGNGMSDYAGATPLYFGQAYSIVRDLFTSGEKATFAALMLNGMPDEACDSRWKITGPTGGATVAVSGGGRTFTLSAGTWPAGVVVGATVMVQRAYGVTTGTPGWYAETVVSVSGDRTAFTGSYAVDFPSIVYGILDDFDQTKHCGLVHFLSQRADRPTYAYTLLSDRVAPLASNQTLASKAQSPPCATSMALCSYAWTPGDVREQTLKVNVNVLPQKYKDVPGVTAQNWDAPSASAPWWALVYKSPGDLNQGYEILRITGRTSDVTGDVYTVQRGEYSYPLDIPDTTAGAYGNVMIMSKGWKYEPQQYGLDNRQLWGTMGLIGIALALAEDDPVTVTYQGSTVTRAAALASLATVWFKEQVYESAKDEFTLFTSGAIAYGNGRSMVGSHHPAFVISNSFSDIDFLDRANNGAGSFPIAQSEFNQWWFSPWDYHYPPRWGQTPTAGSIRGPYIHSCTNSWLLYPGSTEAQRCYDYLKATGAWDASYGADPTTVPTSVGWWIENNPSIAMLLSNYPDGWSRSTYSSVPSSKIWSGGASGETDSLTGTRKGQKVFASRTDWTSSATGLYGYYPDSISDKFPYLNPNEVQSGYYLGKKGWLIAPEAGAVYPEINHTVESGEYYTNSNNAVFPTGNQMTFSNPKPLYPGSTSVIARKQVTGTASTNFLHVQADLKNDWVLGHSTDANNAGNRVARNYRHFAHFKSGKEFIVLYDDIASNVGHPVGQQIAAYTHYPNNGETSAYPPNWDIGVNTTLAEGYSVLDSTVAYMRSNTGATSLHSGNGGSEVITTWVMPTAGSDPYVGDVSVRQNIRVPSQFTLNYDCSASYPCRAKFGGNAYSYTTPVIFTLTGPTIACCSYSHARIFIDTDGAIKARMDTGVDLTFTSGSFPKSTAASIPTGAVLIADIATDWGGSVSEVQCPGTQTPGWYGGAELGRAGQGCAGYYETTFPSSTRGTTRKLVLNAGTTSSAEIITVHRPTATLGETAPTVAAVSGGTNYEGVAIADATDPAIAIFPRNGYVGTGVSFTAPASTANYRVMVAGLQGGATYTLNGAGSYAIAAGDDTLYLTDVPAGSVEIAQGGTTAPLALATPACASVLSGVAYSCAIPISGGVTPYASCAMQSGTLPSGLTIALQSSDCVISGTTTGSTATGLVVRVTDAAPSTADSSSFTLTVSAGTPPLEWVTSSLPSGTVGTAYSQSVTCTNGTGSITYSLSSGALPDDLSISSAGAITGTPSAAGVFPFTLACTDGSTSPSRNLSITIVAAPADLAVSAPTISATWGSAVSASGAVVGSGGTGPYTYTAANLPTGLSLSSAGVLSGTTYVAPGSYVATATATDSTTASVEAQWTITVAPSSVGSLTAELVSVGSTAAILRIGRVGQAADAACRVYSYRDGSLVATASPSIALSRWPVTLSGLLPSTAYTVKVVCGGHSAADLAVTTTAVSTVPRSIRLYIPTIASAASIRVVWTLDGVAQTNAVGTCATRCTVDLPANRGALVTYTIQYLNSGGDQIATRATQQLVVK